MISSSSETHSFYSEAARTIQCTESKRSIGERWCDKLAVHSATGS